MQINQTKVLKWVCIATCMDKVGEMGLQTQPGQGLNAGARYM